MFCVCTRTWHARNGVPTMYPTRLLARPMADHADTIRRAYRPTRSTTALP